MNRIAKVKVSQTGQLSTLAEQINAEHQSAEQHVRKAIEHALNAGRLLIKAKSRCKHGEFLPWLAKNTNVTARQGQRYMRVATNWTAIESKSDATSHLTIDAALGLLAEPIAPSSPKYDAASHLTKEGNNEDRADFFKWCDAELPDMPDDKREELWQLTKKGQATAFNILANWDIRNAIGGDKDELAEEADFLGIDEIRKSRHIIKEQASRRMNAFGLPALTEDKVLLAAGVDSIAEIVPHAQPGYFYVSVTKGLFKPSPPTDYTKRGVSRNGVSGFLRICEFVPTTDWTSSDFDGELPWYIKADGNDKSDTETRTRSDHDD